MNETLRLKELCRSVSHDLNNYVGIALGYLEFTRLELVCPEDVAQGTAEAVAMLSLVEAACTRVKNLSAALCDYADGQRVYSQPYPLNEVVAAAVEDYPTDCLSFEPCPRDVSVGGDRDLFLEAFQEVLRNALEAVASRSGSEGGVPTVKVQVFCTEEADAAFQVGVRIEDNGDGIDPKLLPRVFDPCFTTKGKGRGFGLSRADSRVARSGAAWNVRSEPGKGSCFAIVWGVADSLLLDQELG